jgi:hypothetical protein
MCCAAIGIKQFIYMIIPRLSPGETDENPGTSE